MTLLHPTCDRHTNLLMVPCWLRRGKAIVSGHTCPVPGCGRFRVEGAYLNAADVELVVSPAGSIPKKGAMSESTRKKTAARKAASDQPPPMNRHAAARAAILKAIEGKQHS